MSVAAADEFFDHAGSDDPSWTEKVCAMAALADGSLQAAFGMGKYVNRGVLDAYAGVSRGVEQWTVRASRHLGFDTSTAVGPITYEVLEPLRAVRLALADNDIVPIAFDIVFRAALPCAREDESQFEPGLVRYHQIGTAEGWIALDGERVELDDANSVSTRDHSWGNRRLVGKPEKEQPHRSNVTTTVIWSPILMTASDGSRYGLHTFYQRHAIGDFDRSELIGGFEYPDGSRSPYEALVPTSVVNDGNRRLRSATFDATVGGVSRPLTVTALGDTGFHLGTGLYFGFDGHWHGEDRGELNVEGEYIADCSAPEVAHRVHQIRDNLVRVEDPVGGGVGVGNMQTIFSGPHPDLGLTEEASFM